MGKRVADQHAVMDRGWEFADELADVVRALIDTVPSKAWLTDEYWNAAKQAEDALRRYEEARNG